MFIFLSYAIMLTLSILLVTILIFSSNNSLLILNVSDEGDIIFDGAGNDIL